MNSQAWWVILILGIWLCAAIATAFTKDPDCLGCALVVTLAIGFGYFFLKLLPLIK